MNKKLLDLIKNNNYSDIYNYINKINDINKDTINGNNILHLLSAKGSLHIIKLLQEYTNYFKFSNNDGDTPIHLLAKYGYFDLLKKCVMIDKNIGLLVNNNNDNILFLTFNNKPLLYWLLDNSNYDINIINNDNMTLLIKTIMEKDNILLNKLINLPNIILNKPTHSPPINALILSKNIKGVDLFLKYGANPNIIDSQLKTPLIYSVLIKNIDICKKLIQYGADVNFVGIDKIYNPLTISLIKNSPKISSLLLKNNINVNSTNKLLETPVHIALKLAKNNKINDKILFEIIKKADLNIATINGITPLYLIKKNNLNDKLKPFIKNNKITNNKITNNKITNNKITNNKILYGNKLINNIKMISSKNNYNYGLFSPDIITNIILIIGMLKKYKNIAIPYQHTFIDKKKYDLNKINLNKSIITDDFDVICDLYTIYNYFFYNFVPYIFLWKDKNLYYFPHNLRIYSKNILSNNKKRFIIFKLTLIPNNSGSHANIIIFDKKNMTVERFEPFGYNSLLDADILDIRLESFFKNQYNNIKYVKPKDYLNKIKFQIISDDNNPLNKKIGDPFGYCLAWTYWYMELKINNPDDEPVELINNAYNNIIAKYGNQSDFMLNFIRDYARELDILKNNTLKNMNINETDFYNVYNDLNLATNLINTINQYFLNNNYFL
jgi:ankyrin repeat protein